MEVFVARQPIFTKEKEIFAYELLYRNNQENKFPEIDGDIATSDVLVNSFINIGINDLSNGKPCFINFTERLLKLKLPTFFNPNEIVVEILETVELNKELLEICKELKCKGYQIALDDFVLDKNNPVSIPLLEYVDVIKVDFRQSSTIMRIVTEDMGLKYNKKLLAEKIETLDEFNLAVNRGYDYFQGYFFSKPVILSSQDVPEYFKNQLVIMNHLSHSEPDLEYIAKLIEQDLSLSYKLLKLINSPAYRGVSKINSIRQAVVRLGLNELKKWIYILAIRGNFPEKSDFHSEIFHNCLTRAKMCELIANHHKQVKESSSYFLTGMFSLMDVLLGMEMEKILNLIPLQEDICFALNGHPNQLRDTLNLAISIENGDWEKASHYCKKINIDDELSTNFYHEAFIWANSLMSK